MGQNWWWVVLLVVVIVGALYALWAQTRRADAEPRSDAGVAPEGAAQSEPEAEARDTEGPAGGAPSRTEEERPGDAEATATGPRTSADEAAGRSEPAAAAPKPAGPEEGTAVQDESGQDEPADSALAALDSNEEVGTAASYGAAAAAVSAAVTRPGPYEGSVLPAPDGSAPSPDYAIKANDGSRRYHTPDSPYYVRTRADVWFRTPEDAQAAGFTAGNAR